LDFHKFEIIVKYHVHVVELARNHHICVVEWWERKTIHVRL